MPGAQTVNDLVTIFAAWDDEETSSTAWQALDDLRDPSTVPALLLVLQNPHLEIRELTADLLGKIGDVRAVMPLIEVLSETIEVLSDTAETYICQTAATAASVAEALGKLGDRRAVTPLIEALKNSSPDVREEIVYALGELQDTRAFTLLERLQGDENEVVRHRAREAHNRLLCYLEQPPLSTSTDPEDQI